MEIIKGGELFKGLKGSDVSSNKMILSVMKAKIECCYKHTHTHGAHTLSDTHTSFPETYLLSHTPRSLSNPP